LPLSGAFVDMLRRLVAIAGSTATAEGENSAAEGTGNRAPQVVPATRVLDGFGAFTTPPPTARPIPSNFTGRGSLDHPPGFYGPPEGLVAVNTLAPADRPAPLDVSPLNARSDIYRHGEPLDLRGPIFLAALALLMLDALVVLMLSGGLTAFGRRRRAATAVLLAGLVISLTAHDPIRAQTAPQQPRTPPLTAQQQDFAMKATLQTHLAYIITGDAAVDEISKAGRRAPTLFRPHPPPVDAGEPIGLDPARDELAFFPLIYWPIVPNATRPTQIALTRLDAHMKQCGTVLV